MKIVSLSASNVKRIRAVSIKPDSSLVEITGKNGQGKTSVLDAIYWALAGGRAIQSQPIRHGAEKGEILLDLGDMTVRRTFKLKEGNEVTTDIVVEGKDGLRYKKPQDILNGLVDTLTFDPLAFLRAKPDEQFNTLCQFVPEFDFAAHDRAQQSDFAKRTDANRESKRLWAAAQSIVIPEDFEPIDEQSLIDQMAEASATNDQIRARAARRKEVAEDAARLIKFAADARLRVQALKEEIAQLEANAERQEQEAADLNDRLAEAPELPPLVDVSELQQKIAEARAHNAAGARADEKCRLSDEANAQDLEAKRLTERMALRDIEKQVALEKANLPIKGLELKEGRVFLGGVPFDQASDAEQLRASCAIAMAGNPKLRVIRVRDGSLLDPEAIGLLAEMAEERDMQVWIETVASDRPAAVVIEDGMVKES